MAHANTISIPLQKTNEQTKNGNSVWQGYICYQDKPLTSLTGIETKKNKDKKDGSGTWTDHKILLSIGDDLIAAVSFLPRGIKEDGTEKKQMLIADIQFGDFHFPASSLLNDETMSLKLIYSEYGYDRNEQDQSQYKKNYVIEDPTFDLDDAIDELAKSFPEYQEWYQAAFPSSSRFESKEVKSKRLNDIFALAKGRAKKEELDWN